MQPSDMKTGELVLSLLLSFLFLVKPTECLHLATSMRERVNFIYIRSNVEEQTPWSRQPVRSTLSPSEFDVASGLKSDIHFLL